MVHKAEKDQIKYFHQNQLSQIAFLLLDYATDAI